MNITKTSTSNPNERLLKFLQASPEKQAEIDRILNGAPAIERPTGPLLYGMSAAAKLLGVSRATLWRMIKAKKLTKVDILPGSSRLRKADLEALVANRQNQNSIKPEVRQ